MERSGARRRQRGTALVMAIMITAVSVIIITALTNTIVAEYHLMGLNWRQVQALYCAEAGLDRTVAALQSSPGLTAIAETPLAWYITDSEGTWEARIEPVQSNGIADPAGSRQITVTAYLPNKATAIATRTVTAIYGTRVWDIGTDAVRARKSVLYGSNTDMTVIVDSSYNTVVDPSIDATVRVSGTGPADGPITNVAGNLAHVAGSVHAPGDVDILDGNANSISENDPNNYVPDAFPDPSALGNWDAFGNLIWPPSPNTWAGVYLRDALTGGFSLSPSGNFTGSKYIDLNGVGTLQNATLTGPGTVFVHGNLGANVTNGSPPVTLVVSGSFLTFGTQYYRFNPDPDPSQAPPPSLVLFGPSAEIRGNSNWYLNGPLLMLNPNGTVIVNDSALGCYGSLVSAGTIYFKSSQGALGFPQFLAGKRYTLQGTPGILSYAAQ